MRQALFLVLLISAVLASACGGSQTTTLEQAPPPPPEETALVRFIHAIPDGQRIDATVGDVLVADDINFEQAGDWAVVPAGRHEIVLRSGEVVHFSDQYTLMADERYLVIAYGTMSPILDDVPAGISVVQDERLRYDPQEVYIRFANAVADGDPLGMVVTTDDYWRLIHPRQDIGTVSEYKLGPVDENTFELIPAHNTSLPAVFEFDHQLQLGYLYTFVVTGRQANDTMSVFTVVDHPSMR